MLGYRTSEPQNWGLAQLLPQLYCIFKFRITFIVVLLFIFLPQYFQSTVVQCADVKPADREPSVYSIVLANLPLYILLNETCPQQKLLMLVGKQSPNSKKSQYKKEEKKGLVPNYPKIFCKIINSLQKGFYGQINNFLYSGILINYTMLIMVVQEEVDNEQNYMHLNFCKLKARLTWRKTRLTWKSCCSKLRVWFWCLKIR